MDASEPVAAAIGATDAWVAARRAADAAGVRLSTLAALEDCDRINRVVEAVWGAQELQPELVRAMQLAGCVLIGATADDSDDLVGFVWGFAGWSQGPHLHSHMLATVPALQSRGVGFALKLAQRAAALDAGLDQIRWTYDPLMARNAWFNLMKLGAAGTAFLPEFYGAMTDQLNAGDRSDRFEARWFLRSDRVVAAAAGSPAPEPIGGVPLLEAAGDPANPDPVETGLSPAPGSTVSIPVDFLRLRRADPALGARWRDATARAFRSCFDVGLVAAAVSRSGVYRFDMVKEPDDHG
jgi:predicted GNAT superfamily acetyltransferase